MPFRIVVRVGGEAVVLELNGWLREAEVAVFEETCASQGGPVRIDLEHLLGLDAEGLQALHRQRARGVRITGASPYIEMLMSRTADASAQGSNGGRQ
jgi:anti-anti-sigma regulatory factor